MNFAERREVVRRIYYELFRESILAAGRTAPNPAVAAVVLARDGAERLVLFGGGTEPPPSRHAEIVALDRCRDAGATPCKIYVTLEPCSHHGRTPPCVDRILSEPSLKRIVVLQLDPGLPRSGVDLLRSGDRHVRVVRGADDMLRGFLDRLRGSGPRYHIKYALSADGYMAGRGTERLMISGPRARAFVMLLRSRVDAVLVGPGTVAGDRPGLDVRSLSLASPLPPLKGDAVRGNRWIAALLDHSETIAARLDRNEYQPDRVFILGRPFDEQAAFFQKQDELGRRTGRNPVYWTTKKYAVHWPEVARVVLPDLDDGDFGAELRRALAARGYNEVLIEGGPRLLENMAADLKSGDRGYILRSRRVRAGQGLAGPRLDWSASHLRLDLGDDELEIRQL